MLYYAECKCNCYKLRIVGEDCTKTLRKLWKKYKEFKPDNVPFKEWLLWDDVRVKEMREYEAVFDTDNEMKAKR